MKDTITVTDADKSQKPISRIGMGHDMPDIFNDGKGPIVSHQAAAHISPLKLTYKSSLPIPGADRPASATSKYSAVVFSQPKEFT